MGTRIRAHEVPARVATGVFILRAGLDMWDAGDEQAATIHQMAAGTYPVLRSIPPRRFARLLSVTELTVGTALLAPVVPTAIAGAALTAFGAGLLGLYLRTPGMRRPGTIWPSEQGIVLAKDVWLVGIGLSLLLEGVEDRRACEAT
jgi:hypothetical protein